MKNKTGPQHSRLSVTQAASDLRPKAAALAVAACFSSVVLANPTTPTVAHGTASFNQAGSILNVTNSHNAIINWGSFSIGINELTRFIQPSALSAVLNRVVGQDPSAILGALQSNGRVFLLNPNGIVFGAGSQINVAGLVASTLKLSNEDFLNNRLRFTDGAGAGSVVNQGSITGGSVYLVGNAVTNQGLITSPNGEVVLAAGNSVELVSPGTPNLRVEIQAGDNEARNLGSVVADAGRIGIYAGLVKQGGVINADSAVAEGGRIVLKSTKNTTLEAGSVTSARGTSGGEILALSGMTDGVTQVNGRLDASAVAGNGGFIETSAATVNVADSAFVTTAGGGGGRAGTWLIDPTDFVIASYGGNITGSTLGTALDSGNVAYASADGSVLIQDNVAWSSGNNLSLTAFSDILFGVSSGIALDGGTNGSVTLTAAGGSILTNQAGSYDVRAGSLTATAANGIGNSTYYLRTDVANANLTNTTGGDIYLQNLSTLGNVSAINPAGSIWLSNSGDVNVGVGSVLSAGNAVQVYAPHIEIHGDVSGGTEVTLNAYTAASLIVGSGANVTSSAGNVYLTSDNIDLSGAGVVKGNNIFIENNYNDFDIGVNPNTFNQTMAPASFAKLELNTPASGAVQIRGNNALNVNEPITLAPAKAEILELVANYGVTQTPSGAITVKKLYADGGESGVWLDQAANSVEMLSGRVSSYYYDDAEFRFRNSGSLEIGTVGGRTAGIRVDGGESSRVAITLTSGDLTVNAPIEAVNNGYYSYGDARVELTAEAGRITINNLVSAEGGGYARIDVTASSDVTINSGGVLSAYSNNYYTDSSVEVSSTGGKIDHSGAISAEGGEGAYVSLVAAGDVTLNPGAVVSTTTTGGYYYYYGGSAVEIESTGGNIVQNAMVSARAEGAEGGGDASVELYAPLGRIEQTNSAGILLAASNYGYSSIELMAASGIGSSAAPVRIDNLYYSDIYAQNTGSTGDIALSFANNPLYIYNLSGVSNSNPAGVYFVQSESGGLYLYGAFVPDVPLSTNQSVVLKALGGGNIYVDGSEGAGVIIPGGGGTGTVGLIAEGGGTITLSPGSVIAGYQPKFMADDMDIQGRVLSSGTLVDILPATPGRSIELGTVGPSANALALSNDELNNITAWSGNPLDIPLAGEGGGGLLIGDAMGGSGALTFTMPVNSSAFLNVRGTTISQVSTASITGSINFEASDSVTLDAPGNQINMITGLAGGAITVATASPLVISGVNTPGGAVNIQSAGDITFATGGMNAAAGNVQLTSGGAIIDANTGVDIIANAATLTAPGGIGTLANPLETSVLQLTLNSTGGTGQEIGVINAGNLSLQGLVFDGGFAAVGATGVLDIDAGISTAGSVSLSGNTGLNVNNSISSSQSISLASGAGTLLVGSENSVNAGGTVGLAGNNIVLDEYAGVYGSGGVTVNAAGSLSLLTYSQLGGSGITNIATGGNVLVDRGSIYGDPKVIMKVGGTINVNGVLGQPGVIEAATPTTIIINFPMLASGGYFVNGVEGAIYDALTSSGFLAQGVPAVLGSTMLVTYGAGGTLSPPTNTLIVAMGESIAPPDPEKDKSIFDDEKDLKKKKDAPVCR